MTDIKKFTYTTGGLFTLSGDYIGYYNVVDNVAYASKYEQVDLLEANKSIQTAVALSDKFYNRIPTENITLSYTLSDFLFQPNEYVNTNSINLKIEKSFNNFIDIYKSCFSASSKLPYNYTGLARVSATNTSLAIPIWQYSSSNTYTSAFSAYNPEITRNSKISFIPNQYATNEHNHTLVIANLSSVMVFNVNRPLSTFNPVFSSYRVETNNIAGYSELKFKNIVSVANSSNYFYICDSGNNAVYAYDITGVLTEDRALGKKFDLVNTVYQKQGGFTTPALIAASDNTIYVYDTSGIIYFYDKNFNRVNSYKNNVVFSATPPVSLTYYKLQNQLFVLTSDFKIIVLDSLANSAIYSLNTTGFISDEVPIKLIFSNTDSDVFYLLTNKTLYKKFISNIYGNIGNFSFVDNITGSIVGPKGLDPFSYLYDIVSYDSLQNYDNILVYGYDQLLSYNEKTLFDTILK